MIISISKYLDSLYLQTMDISDNIGKQRKLTPLERDKMALKRALSFTPWKYYPVVTLLFFIGTGGLCTMVLTKMHEGPASSWFV